MNRDFFREFFYKTITPKIIEALNRYRVYDRALYIECDNGFLVEFVQANEIHGIENSEIQSVPIVKRIDAPDKVYDLIILSEKDYNTYSEEQIYNWIIKSAARIIAIVGTEDYMKKYTNEYKFGKLIECDTIMNDIQLRIFEFDESLRVYE
jgi:hypothetical protein